MLILLSFVAVSIVWVVVKNIVDRGAEDIDFTSKCLELDFEVTQKDCNLGVNGDDCDITVKRNAGGDEIAGIKLVLTNATAKQNNITIHSGNIEPSGLKTVNIPETGILNVNKVDVVPYLEDAIGNPIDCTI
jgi:hypothetical protein